MFDLRADDGSVRKKEGYLPPATAQAAGDTRARRSNSLDSGAMLLMHRRLTALYTQELDRQFSNRQQQALDADFYDNEQWREEDKQVLEDRGQVPLVYNVISNSVDWVTGTEKRTRPDWKVLPRRKEDSKPATRKTELLKYLSDVNRTQFHISRAFKDAVKVGIGWMEDGISGETDAEPLYSRYESWRNMLWDSAATELSLDDARYIFRTKWVDLDVACAYFPKRKRILEQAASDSDNFQFLDTYGDDFMDSQELALEQAGESKTSDRITGYQRRRVRLMEAWIRMPVKAPKMKGGTFTGELYDEYSPGHQADVDAGDAEVVERPVMRMHVGIFCSAGMLWYSQSPYRHNRFPFTPIWAFQRDKDRMPYGMIRRLRDIQEDINKRASKALAILSSNKVIMDEGALPKGTTLEEFADEVARPDAIIVKVAGKEIKLDVDRELSQWHLELMSRSIAMVQQASGVTDEQMGRRTNAVSGKAIQSRQDQGAMTTTEYFDNLRLARQIQGEKQNANIEQFMSEEKAFRITNMRGSAEYVTVNDGLPENDIVRSKADFVISEADWRASVRQAQADELLDLLGKLAPVSPQVVVVMLDLLIESMDIPNREELVKRIRQVTGMRDPDAEELTPEDVARAEQQQKAAALQEADAQATVRKKGAEAALAEARAEQTRSQMTSTNVDAQTKALAAAREAIVVPESAPIADHILAESGFVSASDKAAALTQLVAGLSRGQGMPPAAGIAQRPPLN
jgi:hypothetical protein